MALLPTLLPPVAIAPTRCGAEKAMSLSQVGREWKCAGAGWRLSLLGLIALACSMIERAPAVSVVATEPSRRAERAHGVEAWPVLGRSGQRVLDVPSDVALRGRWSLPPGAFEIRSRGRLVLDGALLEGPGTSLTLRGDSVRLLKGTQLALANLAGAGGRAALIATGKGRSAVVEMAATATIDVSGAPGEGGSISMVAERVLAHGNLRALGRGRIEVDSREGLGFSARADTGGGMIRLDPGNMIIGDFGGSNTGVADPDPTHDNLSPSADPGQLDAGLLAGYLASSDVVVHTTKTPSAAGGLDPAVTGDNTPGDIWVQAPVIWNSSHHLYVLANDDLIVQGSVQNGGTGDVVGVAGWDGTTFTGLAGVLLPPTTVYGNGTGDAFVIGSDDASVPGTATGAGVAFGSSVGTTALRGRNV